MKPPVLVAYFFHFIVLGLVWIPMYERLDGLVCQATSMIAMSFGVGAFATFFLLHRMQGLKGLSWLAIAAELLWCFSLLCAKHQLMGGGKDLQLLILIFGTIGFSQSIAFSIFNSMLYRDSARAVSLRRRAVGTIGFAVGCASYLGGVSHDTALEVSIYVLPMIALLLLASLSGDEVQVTNSCSLMHVERLQRTTISTSILLILFLAFVGAFLESANGQFAQKWLIRNLDQTTTYSLILIGLILEASLLTFAAHHLSESTLVVIGFVGWCLVFLGFGTQTYAFAICSCANCTIGFSLGAFLAKYERPALQALLFGVISAGGQAAAFVIFLCQMTFGESLIAWIAFCAAVIAVVAAICSIPIISAEIRLLKTNNAPKTKCPMRSGYFSRRNGPKI